MKTKKQTQYRHLGKRIENNYSGKLGRIMRAVKRTDVKRGWNLWITFDGEEPKSYWTDRDIGDSVANRLVPEDYAPDHGLVPARIQALIERLDEGGIGYMHKHSTTVYVGKDSLTIWRPAGKFIASAHLWAGQGHWKSNDYLTQGEAWASLREFLVSELNKLQYTPQ